MPRPKPSPPDRLRGDLADLQARQDKCRGASLSSRAPRTWRKPGALISRLRTSGLLILPASGSVAWRSPGALISTRPVGPPLPIQVGNLKPLGTARPSNRRSSPLSDRPKPPMETGLVPSLQTMSGHKDVGGPSRGVTRSLSSGRSASDRRRPRRHRSRPPRRRARSLAPARPRRTTGCWTRRGSGRGLSPTAGLPR